MEDKRPFENFPGVKAVSPTANNLLPVILPSGKIHIGWPCRADTAERMVMQYKEID
jgi:hypothetical protein